MLVAVVAERQTFEEQAAILEYMTRLDDRE
jgi:hypothetical protein